MTEIKSFKFGRVPRSQTVWFLTAFVSILVLLVTDFADPFAIFLSASMLANTILRITYPSSYVPAVQTQKGFIYGPVCARIVATIAEFNHYYHLARFCDSLDFVLPLTFIGETLCWMHLLFQSELFGFLEDTVWATINSYAVIVSFNNYTTLTFVLGIPYILYLYLKHLPDTFLRLKGKHLSLPFEIKYGHIDEHSMRWITASMLFQPLCYATFLYALSAAQPL